MHTRLFPSVSLAWIFSWYKPGRVKEGSFCFASTTNSPLAGQESSLSQRLSVSLYTGMLWKRTVRSRSPPSTSLPISPLMINDFLASPRRVWYDRSVLNPRLPVPVAVPPLGGLRLRRERNDQRHYERERARHRHLRRNQVNSAATLVGTSARARLPSPLPLELPH